MVGEISEKVPVMNFMVLRSPTRAGEPRFDPAWIRDEPSPARVGDASPTDVSSLVSRSPVARLIYEKVFCQDSESLEGLLAALIASLPSAKPRCPSGDTGGDSTGADTGGDSSTIAPLIIEELERHAYLEVDGMYHVIPDTLDSYVGQPLIPELIRARHILQDVPEELDKAKLLADFERIFDRPLVEVIYAGLGYSGEYAMARRTLFDALYLLYVLRRMTTVNLEEIIEGLGVLHALQALAIDQLYDLVVTKNATTEQEHLLVALTAVVPRLSGWDGAKAPELPLINHRGDLHSYLHATPIIHPLIGRLFGYKKPFNDIRPVGVGDLKVVKQWLTGYQVGEIAYIENVLQTEQRSRVHRSLEKSQDTFTLASEQQTETTHDIQTTDRFELKRETEQLVKTDLSVNAGLSLSVDSSGTGYKVVSNVTGGFAYARSTGESAKLASTFAHDVVDKAISRVQERSSQSRTTVQTFESEETNMHQFDNRGGQGHISGIYRWVDKKYTSQVFNFGKRMMFEFVLPEPAALLVQSKLSAFEATLNVPQPPQAPTPVELPDWLKSLDPASIDEAKFREFSKSYALSDFTFPLKTMHVDFVDTSTGQDYFSEHNVDSSTWHSRSYVCRLNAKNYQMTKLLVDGYIYFWGRAGITDESTDPSKVPPNDINTFKVWVDGNQIAEVVNNDAERWYYYPGSPGEFTAPLPSVFQDEQVTLMLGFWDLSQFDLSFHAELELTPPAMKDWQDKVYEKIRAVEQAKVDAANSDAQQAYQAELTTYRNRLDELQATAVNDILQGQSETFNRRTILLELKRQCLAMLTKEMDADDSDDLWTDYSTTGTRAVRVESHRFAVEEGTDEAGKKVTTASFQPTSRQLDVVVPKLPEARAKGRVVQFLEQAFEWQQLSYLPYPYFWATPPRWVELMSRTDRTDPFFTDFLQAGSVRVLVAASPIYNDAILHYLATREPWDGGPSPAIGDPLFIPLYEELRDQQDDMANAIPEGAPWTFTLPTSLVYLENSSTPLPEPGAGANHG